MGRLNCTAVNNDQGRVERDQNLTTIFGPDGFWWCRCYIYIYYVWQNWLHILYCDWFWKSRLGETFEQCPSQNQSEKSGHIVHEPPLHDLKGFPLIECSIYVMGFWRKTHIGFFFPQFKLKSSAILKNLPVLTIISSDIDHWHWPVTLF